MLLDDQELHDQDEQLYIADDEADTEVDDDLTPADTDEESDEPKKETAEQVKERQKKAWIDKIKKGEKTLDDMPNNLKWLRDDVEKEVSGGKPSAKTDDLEVKIRRTLQAEKDKEEFVLLADSLEESSADEETLAGVRDSYQELVNDGVSQLKALKLAMKLNGMKDADTVVKERRKKGMLLPPNSSQQRKVVSKDGLTEMERKFTKQEDLPPSFRKKK